MSVSFSAVPGVGSVKSGFVERDTEKTDSPDAIKKTKLNMENYLVIFCLYSPEFSIEYRKDLSDILCK